MRVRITSDKAGFRVTISRGDEVLFEGVYKTHAAASEAANHALKAIRSDDTPTPAPSAKRTKRTKAVEEPEEPEEPEEKPRKKPRATSK